MRGVLLFVLIMQASCILICSAHSLVGSGFLCSQYAGGFFGGEPEPCNQRTAERKVVGRSDREEYGE